MRRVCVLVAIAMVAACGGNLIERQTPTTPPMVTSTTRPIPATTQDVATTTSFEAPRDDAGSESIGVTDEVTITVSDPP